MAQETNSFAGLTDAQVRQLLEKIASTADLMASMCRTEADRNGEKDVSLLLHAMETMLCGIGAMADLATGGNAVGDLAAWMVGPMFHQAQNGRGAV